MARTPRWEPSARTSASGANAAGDLVTAASPAGDVVGRPLAADGGLVRAYTERTPGSAASFEAARRGPPGGGARGGPHYPPQAPERHPLNSRPLGNLAAALFLQQK